MEKKKAVFSIIIAWIVLIIGFSFYNELILRTGREVMLKTVPVDPRDFLRGDYVTLKYEISEIKDKNDYLKENQPVFIVLNVDDKNIATAESAHSVLPEDRFFIKGKVIDTKYYQKSKIIKYGIESYFVKEGTGKGLEKRLNHGGYAKVRIDKHGNAKIKEILTE